MSDLATGFEMPNLGIVNFGKSTFGGTLAAEDLSFTEELLEGPTAFGAAATTLDALPRSKMLRRGSSSAFASAFAGFGMGASVSGVDFIILGSGFGKGAGGAIGAGAGFATTLGDGGVALPRSKIFRRGSSSAFASTSTGFELGA